jgi:hypothetical protein
MNSKQMFTGRKWARTATLPWLAKYLTELKTTSWILPRTQTAEMTFQQETDNPSTSTTKKAERTN